MFYIYVQPVTCNSHMQLKKKNCCKSNKPFRCQSIYILSCQHFSEYKIQFLKETKHLVALNFKHETGLLYRILIHLCLFSPIQQQTHAPGLLAKYCLDKKSSYFAGTELQDSF